MSAEKPNSIWANETLGKRRGFHSRPEALRRSVT
jgi:hypothetical protein